MHSPDLGSWFDAILVRLRRAQSFGSAHALLDRRLLRRAERDRLERVSPNSPELLQGLGGRRVELGRGVADRRTKPLTGQVIEQCLDQLRSQLFLQCAAQQALAAEEQLQVIAV